MINDAQVFLSGYVAREPKYRITSSGHAAVTLRVGYTPRRVDRESGEWMDGATSFVTVVCWRDAGPERGDLPAQGRTGAGPGAVAGPAV